MIAVRAILSALGALIALAPAASAAPATPATVRADVESFIAEMAAKHAFDAPSLRRLFLKAQPRPAVIRAISTPGTARPWYEYRANMVEEHRIAGGLEFWRRNAEALTRAERVYGVPPEIIVATIGIETLYGRNVGRFRVLEALSMLAFDYPPRAALFRSELEQLLLLSRETGFDAYALRGSYAGAMGIPQFLPSSYRQYAVDFDGDGHPDLWRSTADAIGSVANYYRNFGWESGAPVAIEATAEGEAFQAALAAGIEPRTRVAELRLQGVAPLDPVDDETRAALLRVEGESGAEYWLGFTNFYVITRYNRSVNYALGVYELARELRARMPDAALRVGN